MYIATRGNCSLQLQIMHSEWNHFAFLHGPPSLVWHAATFLVQLPDNLGNLLSFPCKPKWPFRLSQLCSCMVAFNRGFVVTVWLLARWIGLAWRRQRELGGRCSWRDRPVTLGIYFKCCWPDDWTNTYVHLDICFTLACQWVGVFFMRRLAMFHANLAE